MKKTFKVVMLPTEKAGAPIQMRSSIGDMHPKYPKGYISFIPEESRGILDEERYWIEQHLYILSDEEIPYNPNGGTDGHFICLDEINQNKYHNTTLGDKQYINPYVENVGNCKGCRKIVATTDSLHVFRYDYLPQLPASFIQAYIKAYNEGKPITEVDLEIELHKWVGSTYPVGHRPTYQIKTRPDNTVIVHQSKTYSRDEVIKLLELYEPDAPNKRAKFINENL